MSSEQAETTTTLDRARRPMLSGVIALSAAWFFFGTGKWLHVNLDTATDYAAIAAASGRFLTGAILQLIAGILLAVGVAALMITSRDAAPKLTAVGGWIAMIGAVGTGGFAQFNLLQVAMADPSLDRTAFNDFLVGPLAEVGVWGVPIMLVLFAVPVGLFLLALGTARAGITSYWPAWLIIAYVVIHLGVGSTVVSHYLLGAVLAWIGISVLRSQHDGAASTSDAEPIAVSEAPVTEPSAGTTRAV
jgi:hypothetical protein